MKSNLLSTQKLFWLCISHPSGIADFLAHADSETQLHFQLTFAETTDFSRRERVEIYAEAYFFRLFDVLREMYPLLNWQLGQTRMHNMVTDYLLQFPSRSPNLRHLGDALPQFLAAHALCKDFPQIVDFTRIELAIHRALDAADGAPLTTDVLSGIPPASWSELRFQLVPSAKIVDTSWDFHSFQKAHRANLPPPTAAPLSSKAHVLVWRKQFTVFTRTLDLLEARLLLSLAQGETFGEATSKLERQGESAAQVVTDLSRWLRDEVLLDFD